jgi:hypothetical protein
MNTGARRAAKEKVKLVNTAKSSCDMPGERAPNDGTMQIRTRFNRRSATRSAKIVSMRIELSYRVAAYASVIDAHTNDPTYVPAP